MLYHTCGVEFTSDTKGESARIYLEDLGLLADALRRVADSATAATGMQRWQK